MARVSAHPSMIPGIAGVGKRASDAEIRPRQPTEGQDGTSRASSPAAVAAATAQPPSSQNTSRALARARSGLAGSEPSPPGRCPEPGTRARVGMRTGGAARTGAGERNASALGSYAWREAPPLSLFGTAISARAGPARSRRDTTVSSVTWRLADTTVSSATHRRFETTVSSPVSAELTRLPARASVVPRRRPAGTTRWPVPDAPTRGRFPCRRDAAAARHSSSRGRRSSTRRH